MLKKELFCWYLLRNALVQGTQARKLLPSSGHKQYKSWQVLFTIYMYRSCGGLWRSIPGLAATISEIGYLLLPSRDMAEISLLKGRKFLKQPTNYIHVVGISSWPFLPFNYMYIEITKNCRSLYTFVLENVQYFKASYQFQKCMTLFHKCSGYMHCII